MYICEWTFKFIPPVYVLIVLHRAYVHTYVLDKHVSLCCNHLYIYTYIHIAVNIIYTK